MFDLKFRAWDKISKIMVYRHDGWSDDVDVLEELWHCFKSYEYELMQFTGLIDKNGKQIYVGDIVKIHYGDPENELYIELIEDIRRDCRLGKDVVYEVIGNKFENPELIELTT
jgi:hypothetical protein